MTPPFLGTWELPNLSHTTELQQPCSSRPLRAEAEWAGLRRTPTRGAGRILGLAVGVGKGRCSSALAG